MNMAKGVYTKSGVKQDAPCIGSSTCLQIIGSRVTIWKSQLTVSATRWQKHRSKTCFEALIDQSQSAKNSKITDAREIIHRFGILIISEKKLFVLD
jgi:molybdopterin synthase catalytic subunit